MALTKSIVTTIIELQDAVASGSGSVASSFIQNIGGTTKVATAEEVDTITFNASGSRILTMTHTSSLMELTSSTNYYYSKQTDNNLFFANLMGSQEAIIDKSTGLTKAGQSSLYFEDTQLGGWIGFNGENPLISTGDSGSYLMAIHGTDGEIASMAAYNGLSSAGLEASAKPGNATGRVLIGVDGTEGESRIFFSSAGSGSIIEIDNNSSTGISRITLGDGAVVFSGSAVEVINTTANTTIPIFDSTYTGLPTEMPSIVGGLHVLSSSIASGGGSGNRIESPDGTTAFIQAFNEEKLESYVSSSTGVYRSVVSGTFTDFGPTFPVINKQEMLEAGDIKVLQTANASSDLETGTYRTMVYTGVDLQNPDNESSIELVSGTGSSFVRLRADDTGEFGLYSDFAYVMVSGSTDPVTIVNSGAPNLPTGMNSIVHGLHILSSSIASGDGSVSWSLQPAISDINADNNKIVNLADPTGSFDAVNLQTMQSSISGAIGAIILPDVSTWSEYSASQDINVGNNKIINLADPVTGSDAATKAYVDTAVPELEWWDPVWTPATTNITSVNNIECQYTRVYRAAGGSLVTLEGTLRVEINNDNAFTIFTTQLPVPATGTGSLRAPGICTAADRSDRSMVRITLSGSGSERNLSISAPPLLDATGVPATLTIGFRISYRAA